MVDVSAGCVCVSEGATNTTTVTLYGTRRRWPSVSVAAKCVD